MMTRKSWIAGSLLFALGIALGSLLQVLPAGSDASPLGVAAAQPPAPASRVLLAFGVGGVLTGDGRVLQYRPDTQQWLSIDEAFRQEGRETNILPLPVRADQIRQMESFGFLLTNSGEAWLYEMSTDQWRKLPNPA
ncbi:MAG: hypothetical protein FJY75_02640 [Candidatus Eisenbacteria bacterium]|uniref:Uncharacterized protein n=1 Tax=Eiseniibacteriota bacterium TaxID=2212470 RepID=A0A938BQ37_UNCEI|nr:hypothetical protein [Candidatus Eisenbacteria bacterium]